MSITDFLNARITEDEAHIQAHTPDFDECQECGFGQQPESPYSIARVLAECAAKRAIVEMHAPVDYSGLGMESPNACTLCGADRGIHDWEWMKDSFPCDTLRTLAAVYAEHPEYRDAWKVAA